MVVCPQSAAAEKSMDLSSSAKSLRHNSFADPHPLTSVASIFYKKQWGERVPQFQFFPYIIASLLPYIFFSKSFTCKTYGGSRKCCKQKTYGLAKLFICNTYKETRE